MTLVNGTKDTLIIYFKGPVKKMAKVPPNKSVDVELRVGRYEVAAEVKTTGRVRVRPFYGKQEYRLDAHYWLKFYLKRK